MDRANQPQTNQRSQFRAGIFARSLACCALIFLSAPHISEAEEPRGHASAHRLSDLDLWLPTLFYVDEMYVDPGRLDWEKLLVASTEAVERFVPTARFRRVLGESLLEVEVGRQHQAWQAGHLESAEELSAVMFQVASFLERHVDPLTLPVLPDLTPLEGVEFAMVNGMLGALDPHSRLLTPLETRELDQENRGAFDGLGVVLSDARGPLVIVETLEGGPADLAGVRSGDLLIRIDGENTLNMSLDEAVEHLRGQRGEPIDLVLDRSGIADPVHVTVLRGRIALHPVTMELLEGRVAYVNIESFHQDVDTELAAELQRVRRLANGEVEGIIMDLRGNPGGFLNQAVDVADRFLREGTIVTQVDRYGRVVDRNDARWTGQEWSCPMVILVDQYSASASEIVAGALRGHEAALLVGQRTFGKGSVQNLYPVREDLKLKLTISRYLTPGEDSIQSVGIPADIELLPVRIETSMDGPPSVDLYGHERSRREVDLMGHLEQQHEMDGPALFHLRFLEQAPDVLGMETPVRLARDLILAAEGPTRTELLLVAQRVLTRHRERESEAIAKRFETLGLDWREGPARGEPVATLVWDPQGPLIPGIWHTLEVQVENRGEGDAHQVVVWLEDPIGLVREPEFPIGRIPPGETKVWRQQVRVPHGLSDQSIPVDIHVREHGGLAHEPTVQRVAVAPRKLPRFGWRWQVEDVGGVEPGVIERGERVRVLLEVSNEGPGWATAPFALLRNRSGRDVELTEAVLHPGIARTPEGVPCVPQGQTDVTCLPQMAPGESWTGSFDLTVGQEVSDGTVLDLHLGIGDERAYDWLAVVEAGFDGLYEITDPIRLTVQRPIPAPVTEEVPPIVLDRVPEAVTSNRLVTLSGKVSDPQGLAHVVVYVDGDKIFLQDNSASPSVQVPFTAEVMLEAGRHVWVVLATDMSGHQTSRTRAVWVEPAAELVRALPE